MLELHIQPNFNNVLPMYVFFLLWAAVAVVLLRRGQAAMVAAISCAVYLVGNFTGGFALAPRTFQVAEWQLLFTAGLLVGWAWEHERLAIPIRLRRINVAVCAAGALTFLVLARTAPAAVGSVFGRELGKDNGGLVAFAFAGMVIVAAHAAVEQLLARRRIGRLIAPLGILGLKGLPGYVTMVVVVAALDLYTALPRNDVVIALIVVACGIAEYTAVQLERSRKARTTVGVMPALARVGAAEPA